MNPSHFLAELKRRNVYKVAVAYAIVGWLLVQISTQVFPFLEIPNWVVRLVIALVAIGFPIALVIAWAFEATPEGIKRTEDADAMARALGTRRGTEIVRQIQLGPAGPIARRLLRSRESFLVSPDELTHLPVGQAAISVRLAQQRVAVVQVDPLRFHRKES